MENIHLPNLITTFGPKRADELGMLLPHEHVFVDLRTPDQPGHAQAETSDVVALMRSELTASARPRRSSRPVRGRADRACADRRRRARAAGACLARRRASGQRL